MPKNKPDKEYYALFLLIFVLAFAFGVVVGCYACSTGSTGDLDITVENNGGNAFNNVEVVVTDGDGNEVATETTDNNGQVSFPSLDNGDYTVTATPGNGNAGFSESISVTIEQGNDVSETITFGGVNDQTPLELVE